MTDASPQTFLLRNARVVLPTQTLESASLIIQDGRIARIIDSSSSESIDADSAIDLDGLTLFPGFIDIHIHGADGIDTMDATADDLRRVGAFLASRGVTAWMPTLVPSANEQYGSTRQAIETAMREQAGSLRTQARVLGVHYEGPFVNTGQCGALHQEHFKTFKDAADLNELPTIDQEDARHLMTLAPEVEGGIELIKELKKQNWIVSIGHTRATSDVLDQALTAGARHLTHFMNAMTPLHHRSVGAVGWGLIHDEVTCDIIADGIHIDPSILKLIVRTKSANHVSLISDAIAAAGLGDGEYQIWGEKISVRNGRTQNTRGSIAGSVITMLDAVRLMMTLGFSEREVARMASLNAARLIGIDGECGSIEEGKRADLVALDDAGSVRLAIIGGRIAFQESP